MTESEYEESMATLQARGQICKSSEGEWRVNPDGAFTGDYHDLDGDHTVTFHLDRLRSVGDDDESDIVPDAYDGVVPPEQITEVAVTATEIRLLNGDELLFTVDPESLTGWNPLPVAEEFVIETPLETVEQSTMDVRVQDGLLKFSVKSDVDYEDGDGQ